MTQAGSPSTEPAVVVEGVAKTFRMPEERVHTLKERALHPLRRTRHHSFTALKEVNFDVRRGEFFGIVGRNGSGKSTLLKCMAGIYATDRGSIRVAGRLSTFIELGVGFNPDLPARDNVILNGIMLGLSPAEARLRYARVLEFAELEDFQDLKLKNYSSGMHVRLAFSVAIQVDADVLLVDEILAVGDAAFQQKCFDVFYDMRDAGRTIIFVTHDMGAVTRFCHRAMLLEEGEQQMLGSPADVAERYLELNFQRQTGQPRADLTPIAAQLAEQRASTRPGDGTATVTEVWMEDDRHGRRASVRQGQPVVIKARVQFLGRIENPAVTLTIQNEDHDVLIVLSTLATHEDIGTYEPGDQGFFGFWFDNVLAPGRYFPSITVARRHPRMEVVDRAERQFSFVVTGTLSTGGLVDVKSEVDVYRIPAGQVSRA